MNWKFDESGWLIGVRKVVSPNFDDRPHDAAVDLLVVHAISLPPGEFGGDGVLELFANRLDPSAHPYYAALRNLRVSAHFFIRRDGEPVQFVSADKRAWHAGQSTWAGRPRCNDFSVGVELEGSDGTPFTDAQYAALSALSEALYRRYPIAAVVGHSDIAPGRKTDPGPGFEWGRVRRPAPGFPNRSA